MSEFLPPNEGPAVAAFQRLCAEVPAIEGDARLALFEAMHAKAQAAFWHDLECEQAERREHQRRGDEVWHREPQVGRKWERQRTPRQVITTARANGTSTASRSHAQDDPLMEISPPEYFEVLADVDVPRRGGESVTVNCPLHDDRTPSCQVFRDPARGFYCHGCGRGGTVYELAAHLWGYPTPLRGRAFSEVEDRLLHTFHAHYTHRAA